MANEFEPSNLPQAPSRPSAVILCLGTEIMQGFTLNTSAHWLSARLRECGWDTLAHLAIADTQHSWDMAWNAALSFAPSLIIITGGLGPTEDDRTRPWVAQALGVDLLHSAECEQAIRTWFHRRNRPWTDANLVQAMIPAGSKMIPNPEGTAPGFFIETPKFALAAFPGVPCELYTMVNSSLVPWLTSLGSPWQAVELLFHGLPESKMATLMKGMELPQSVSWCSLPGKSGVVFRIYTTGPCSPLALIEAKAIVLDVLGQEGKKCLVSDDGRLLPQVIVDLLKQAGQTFGVAESCTGGLLGAEITMVPGSSAVFVGGALTYANSTKQSILGVSPQLLTSHGAVSKEVAAAMASGVQALCQCDWGLSITGIAGPSGGSAEKPVGLVHMAIAHKDRIYEFVENFSGDREQIRLRTVYWLLERFRRVLLGIDSNK